MNWTDVIPEIAVSAAVFFLPGLFISYLGGLRGITAWAMAPLLTVAIVAAVAMVAQPLHIPFGPVPVLAGTGVMAVPALGLSLSLRAAGIGRAPRDPYRYSVAAFAGVVVAGVVAVATFVTGIGRPGAISQTWDAVFHYSAIRYILVTGNASPLAIGSLNQPGMPGTFYPAAWQEMAALLAQLTGAGVTVVATVTCLIIAALVWPLGCLLLCRHLFGAHGGISASAAVITGLVCASFGPFPWMIMGWGVLWPNTLGMALAPAGVAMVMSITRIAQADTFGAWRRWPFAVVAAWAIAIAHPNAAISVAVIALLPVLIAFGRYLMAEYRSGHRIRGGSVLVVLVVVVVGGWLYASGLPTMQRVRDHLWKPFESAPQAAGEALTSGTNGQHGLWLLSAFMVIGMVTCFIRRTRRWLAVAEIAVAGLYVASAAIGTPFVRQFTGFWYDDSHRLAAILPIVAVPLTVTGLLATGQWLNRHGVRHATTRLAAHPLSLAAVTLAVAVVVSGLTAARSVPSNATVLGREYSTAGDHRLVSPQKRQFFRTVADAVPAGAVVANDPFQGTAALWSLTGTRVLFPQVGLAVNNEQATYLARHLVDLAHDRRACALVRHYGVGYLIVAPDNYRRANAPPGPYRGITYPGARPGFDLVVFDGPRQLYRITRCQPASSPTSAMPATSQRGK